jgi:hypothetical protein
MISPIRCALLCAQGTIRQARPSALRLSQESRLQDMEFRSPFRSLLPSTSLCLLDLWVLEHCTTFHVINSLVDRG